MVHLHILGMQCSIYYVKGVPFANKRYTRRVPFLLKMVYKRPVGGLPYETDGDAGRLA